MRTKKDAQFSFEEYSCAEMMAQMMPQPKGQQGIGDACAEMMVLFGSSQRGGGECIEMMSRIMSVCCGAEEESDEIVSKA